MARLVMLDCTNRILRRIYDSQAETDKRFDDLISYIKEESAQLLQLLDRLPEAPHLDLTLAEDAVVEAPSPPIGQAVSQPLSIPDAKKTLSQGGDSVEAKSLMVPLSSLDAGSQRPEEKKELKPSGADDLTGVEFGPSKSSSKSEPEDPRLFFLDDEAFKKFLQSDTEEEEEDAE